MEMPDVIYALERETPSYRGIWDGYQWSDQSGTEYHHSRIVEALQQQVKILAKAFDEDSTAAECCKAAKLAQEILEEK